MERVAIAHTHRCIWPGSRKAGPVSGDGDIGLTAWLRPKPAGELDVVKAQQLGTSPPLQRRYADREALAAQTGSDAGDVDALRRYCAPLGIAVDRLQWRSIGVRGPIHRVIEAFGATVDVFEDEDQRRFRHRSGALHASAEIAAIVRGVFGLHQWPRSGRLGSLARHATPLRARQVASRYAFPPGDGRGQTVGIVQFNGTFNSADFERSMKAQGVEAALPVVKHVDRATATHQYATSKDLEASLDVQIVAALAPRARIVVYEAPNDERGFLDAVRTAIFDDEFSPSILSISYGWPEHLWTPAALTILDELFTAAALLGISIFCASGDNGAELDAAHKPHVVAPASSPFAMACGATVVTGDDAEAAWQHSGGGFSERFAAPPWQAAARRSASRYGLPAGRGVPDVAAQQMPGYYVIMEGTELAMGGTSAVAPTWAALTARLNQIIGTSIGLFTPALYEKAPLRLFHDVTHGNNGRFKAGAGWNPCTGLGVPIGTAIETALRSVR